MMINIFMTFEKSMNWLEITHIIYEHDV
jgi:hypothetical protein